MDPPRIMPELRWNRHLKEPAWVVGEQRQFPRSVLRGFVKALCNLGEVPGLCSGEFFFSTSMSIADAIISGVTCCCFLRIFEGFWSLTLLLLLLIFDLFQSFSVMQDM
jgi:hypothetical protein